jgi:hypothetical protein
MFNIFKASTPSDVKEIRECLLQFIKQQLQKTEGGEGGNIKGITLYIACEENQKHLYEAAVYANEENRFKKDEVQRIADDFAIDLPANWTMDILFNEPTSEAIKAKNINAALFISTAKKQLPRDAVVAYIKVLNGETEKKLYNLTSSDEEINIGRERKTKTADGFYRENNIAFNDSDSHESNRSVSRQHAHIEWDKEALAFCLYADEGGIPPMNKLKVRDAEGNIFKVQTIEIGHQLKEGDQIMLGESAVLKFTYQEKENI